MDVSKSAAAATAKVRLLDWPAPLLPRCIDGINPMEKSRITAATATEAATMVCRNCLLLMVALLWLSRRGTLKQSFPSLPRVTTGYFLPVTERDPLTLPIHSHRAQTTWSG